MSSATACSRARLRPARCTWAPASANARATAPPIAPPPPWITAVLPSSIVPSSVDGGTPSIDGERRRRPKSSVALEHLRAEERGHRRDELVVEREHRERTELERPVLAVSPVAGDRGLPSGAGGLEAPRPCGRPARSGRSPTSSRPRNHMGIGGMEKTLCCCAAARRPPRRRRRPPRRRTNRLDQNPRVRSWLRAPGVSRRRRPVRRPRPLSSVARARCSALLAAATVVVDDLGRLLWRRSRARRAARGTWRAGATGQRLQRGHER